MTPNQLHKIDAFRARIGFDAAMAREAPGQAVRLRWPDPRNAPGLANAGWQLANDTVQWAGEGAVREWTLRRGPQALSVWVFVSSRGTPPARRTLLRRAADNMMIEVPFVAGPPGLGSLAVAMPPPGPQRLMWVSHTVCIDLRSFDDGLELLPLAQWLQGQVDAARVTEAALKFPLTTDWERSAERVRVGETLRLKLRIADAALIQRCVVDLAPDPTLVEVLAQNGITIYLRGLKAGTVGLPVRLVDADSLLSHEQSLALEFLPPTGKP